MRGVVYRRGRNCLRVEYGNRWNQDRVVEFVFYEGYVVKDEEISMII